MEKELWLSRDKGEDADYNVHDKEPDRDGWDIFSGYIVCFCSQLFHQHIEGARLRKGRKRKIKRILIELED